jgi:WD40 repeat protein
MARLTLVAYGSGHPGDPLGRFEMEVYADGSARLAHHRVTGTRAWTARLEPAVWTRLTEALDRSGFPDITRVPIVPGAVRELIVPTLGEVLIGWHDVAATGLGEVFGILDALVRQVGGGTVRSTLDELPQVAHWTTADGPAEPPTPGTAAAFGTVTGEPACAVAAQGQVRLFSVPGREPLAPPADVAAPVRAVAVGEDLLVAAGDDHVIRAWDARTTAPLHARTGHHGPITGVASAEVAGHTLVLSTATDGDLRAWSLPGGEGFTGILHAAEAAGTDPISDDVDEPGSVGGLTGVRHVRVAGVDLLVAGGDDGVVRVWDAVDGHVVQVFRGHTGWVNAVALLGLGDQGLAASGGLDRMVRVWDISGGRELAAFEHGGSVTGVALTLVGGHPVVGSCSVDGTVRVWDVVTGEALAERQVGDWLTAIAAVSGEFVTTGIDGTARLWDAGLAPRGEMKASSVASATDVARVDGQVLVAVGHKDGSVRLWEDGTQRWALPATDGAVTAVAFGPAGLVVGTDDGTVRVHDLATGDELAVPTPHAAPVLALGLVGGTIVSGGADGTVRTWDARSGVPWMRLLGHTAGVATVAADADVIASAGYDRVVRTWDARTGRPLLAIHGHMYPVYALALGDGLLASASYDGLVRVWDTATGEQRARLSGNDGMVRSLCFAGNDLAVAADDGTVRVWRLPEGELTEVLQAPALAVAFVAGAPYSAGEDGPVPCRSDIA